VSSAYSDSSTTEATLIPATSTALPSSYNFPTYSVNPTSIASSYIVSIPSGSSSELVISTTIYDSSPYGYPTATGYSSSSDAGLSSYVQYSSLPSVNATSVYSSFIIPSGTPVPPVSYGYTLSSSSVIQQNSSYVTGSTSSYLPSITSSSVYVPAPATYGYSSAIQNSSYVSTTLHSVPTSSLVYTKTYGNSSYSIPSTSVVYTTQTSVSTLYGTFTKTVYVPCSATATVISGTTTTVYQTPVTYSMTSPIWTQTLTTVVPCHHCTPVTTSVAPYTPPVSLSTSTSYSTITKESTIYTTLTRTQYSPCPPKPTVVAGLTTIITRVPVVYTSLAPAHTITYTEVVPCDTTIITNTAEQTFTITQSYISLAPITSTIGNNCPAAATVTETETEQVTVYYTMTAPASTVTVTSMGGYFNTTRPAYQTYQ